MNRFYFSAESLLIISFLMVGIMPARAQSTACDSVECSTTSLPAFPDDTHRFTLKEILIPTALVGASALFVGNGWGAKQREKVQDVLRPENKHKIKLDEYLQYSPMVAVYGLNLMNVKGKHTFKERTIILAMSYATMGILVNTMKYTIKERRPDGGSRNSFPSGHTATAFMGAEFLYKEYKDVSPWIGYAGYAIATTTGYLRIYNNRHYFNDVIARACIGILSTKLAYWLYPKIFKKSRCNQRTAIVGLPYYSTKEVGVNVCMVF